MDASKRSDEAARKPGKVYLVGAGPGDPGLLTRRAIECLEKADVVLYDYLANPALESLVSSTAEWICLGRHGQPEDSADASSRVSLDPSRRSAGRIWSQERIQRQMIELARDGKVVVRLKGGDPVVFGRGSEEIEALLAADVPYETVPGITAALAAGSYAGIPLTHRDHASAVALVTGQGRGGRESEHLDYEALAKFPGTLVFYMGVTTAERWSRQLIEGGKSAQTPTAIIRRCSLPDQEMHLTTLGEVARTRDATRLRPPVVFVVGDVVSFADRYDWFQSRPLFGQKILVTRPSSQASDLSLPLRELGADVDESPAIEIGAPSDWSPTDRALQRLDEFDWLIFTSSNGVRYFLDRLLSNGSDLRALGRVRLAVVGASTGQALESYHLKADCQPDEFNAESLAASLSSEAPEGRFLFVRANRASTFLPKRLAELGGTLEQVEVYQSQDVVEVDEAIRRRMQAGGYHWTTVTSSAIARNLVRLFGSDLSNTRLASLSPLTSSTLKGLGFPPSAEADEATMEALVKCILDAGCNG